MIRLQDRLGLTEEGYQEWCLQFEVNEEPEVEKEPEGNGAAIAQNKVPLDLQEWI